MAGFWTILSSWGKIFDVLNAIDALQTEVRDALADGDVTPEEMVKLLEKFMELARRASSILG